MRCTYRTWPMNAWYVEITRMRIVLKTNGMAEQKARIYQASPVQGPSPGTLRSHDLWPAGLTTHIAHHPIQSTGFYSGLYHNRNLPLTTELGNLPPLLNQDFKVFKIQFDVSRGKDRRLLEQIYVKQKSNGKILRWNVSFSGSSSTLHLGKESGTG